MAKNLVSGMLREGLYTRVVGRRIAYFERLPSTMDEAARLAEEDAEDGTVVLAEQQDSARGRFQRQWVTQPGNLYFSVILRPPREGLPYVSIISGLAVAWAIRKATGLAPTIKWPNDVRIRGKKVCGILVENTLKGDTVQYANIGIGINVAFDPSTIDELKDTATGLDAELGKPVDREGLLRYLLHEIDGLYLTLRRDTGGTGGSGTRQTAVGVSLQAALKEWANLLDTLGGQVEVRWLDEVYTGFAEGVDDIGNLILRLADGNLVTLPAGEVTSHVEIAQGR